MAELTLAVLVCNVDGRSCSTTPPPASSSDAGGARRELVGLGRSVFGILDRSLVRPRARARAPRGGGGRSAPRVRLTATAPAAGSCASRSRRCAARATSSTGFVLTLEDVTRAAEARRPPRRAAAVAHRGHARVGGDHPRGRSRACVDYPEHGGGRAAALHGGHPRRGRRHSARASRRRCASRRLPALGVALEEMLGRDLLAALQQQAREEAGRSRDGGEPTAASCGCEVDSYAVVQAAAHLVARLRAERRRRSASRVELRRGGPLRAARPRLERPAARCGDPARLGRGATRGATAAACPERERRGRSARRRGLVRGRRRGRRRLRAAASAARRSSPARAAPAARAGAPARGAAGVLRLRPLPRRRAGAGMGRAAARRRSPTRCSTPRPRA